MKCRHVLIPHADHTGYIWTVCERCGQAQYPEPKPHWFDFREQYERQHASWQRHIAEQDAS